jgi:hypothetical protein
MMRPRHAKRRRPVSCSCGGEATWRKDWTQGNRFYEPEPGYVCDSCGWALSESSIRNGATLPPLADDGRIEDEDGQGRALTPYGSVRQQTQSSRPTA